MDTFRILVITDTHLGYKENDPRRRNDSFESLKYMLSMGRHLHCDFCVHAGDLFDQNKPSKATVFKTLEILKESCLGSGDINFEIESGREQFRQGWPNFESLNMNVALPMFVIHGNHDDPNEEQGMQLAALDILDVSLIERVVLVSGSCKLYRQDSVGGPRGCQPSCIS